MSFDNFTASNQGKSKTRSANGNSALNFLQANFNKEEDPRYRDLVFFQNPDDPQNELRNQDRQLRDLRNSNSVDPKAAANSTNSREDSSKLNKVTVQPGDTLSNLLRKAGFPREKAFNSQFLEHVASLNKLTNKNLIRIGQILQIPVYKPGENENEELYSQAAKTKPSFSKSVLKTKIVRRKRNEMSRATVLQRPALTNASIFV